MMWPVDRVDVANWLVNRPEQFNKRQVLAVFGAQHVRAPSGSRSSPSEPDPYEAWRFVGMPCDHWRMSDEEGDLTALQTSDQPEVAEPGLAGAASLRELADLIGEAQEGYY